jgi:hypothetical protein
VGLGSKVEVILKNECIKFKRDTTLGSICCSNHEFLKGILRVDAIESIYVQFVLEECGFYHNDDFIIKMHLNGITYIGKCE